jgi:hypothetical protein
MATAAQIKTLRLEIHDPYGMIDVQYSVDLASLPSTPAPQTSYLVAADGAYYKTDKESGALPADYARIPLRLSDVTLGHYIDIYGEDRAPGVSLRNIARTIGAEIPLIKTTNGAESIEYQNIMELYRYYKALADDSDAQADVDNGTAGRYCRTRNPNIGGGNL